jgi:hypothetical protein
MSAMYPHNKERNYEIMKRLDRESPKQIAPDYSTSADNIRQISHRYKRWFKKIQIKGNLKLRHIIYRKKTPVDKSKPSQPVTDIPLRIVV